ncbi:MAG: hypothetical protein IH616_13555 [Gemmatimonadales bacterium]|nr:hypothetical protein [Gemmatimonadales bacterium]
MGTRSIRTPVRPASAVLLAFAVMLAACTGRDEAAESPLPAQIHGQELAATHGGEEAARILEGLHGQAVGSEQNWVGVYGTMEMPTLVYVSRFPSNDRARAELDAMVVRIDSGTAAFGHHTWFTRNERTVHSVFGQGQVHYFWANDADLWWLGAHPMIARMALTELLQIPLDSIPELGLPMMPPAEPGGER